MTPDNAMLSEMLARASERETDRKAKAMRRAARSALMWPDEVADVHAAEGRSLSELRSVGPWLARVIAEMIEAPEVCDPPPLRSGFLTYAHARRVVADAGPAWQPHADLQMHTLYSDGTATVEDMLGACHERGYDFVAITDHSIGLKIANGMDAERLADQLTRIDALNDAGAAPRILRSIEMNLSPLGEGDMDANVLARLDVVLAAFHSKLRVKEDQTDRYLAAVRNPTVCTLAHPRGRIFNFRAGLWCDWDRVLAEAARLGKAVEIDAYPDRQDLNVELLRIARDAGCRISIGTDAHHPDELAFIELGVAAAIEAGIPRQNILNYCTADEVVAWARAVRG
jgi:putative hydrolase